MLLKSVRFSLLLVLCWSGLVAADAASSRQPLTPVALQQGLAPLLKDHFGLEGDLAVEVLGLRPGLPPLRSASDWKLVVTEYPTAVSASMIVRLKPVGDGEVMPEQAVVLRANLWREAWFAKEPVATGASFDPLQFEARRVDFLRDREAVPVGIPPTTYVLARGVPAGRLITWRDLTKRPLVRKGEMVEVSASDGRLALNLKGIVMQSGGQGDHVTVRNPDSKKDFSAYVIDENRVQVRF